jgi:hypothetical protein
MNVYPTDVYGEHRVDQMSVREYFAINILQSSIHDKADLPSMVKRAVKISDMLIEELEKKITKD